MHRPRVLRWGAPPSPSRSFRAVLLLAAACWSFPARADGVSGYAEWSYSRSESSISDPLGAVSETFTRSFRQRYRLNWERRLFPNVQALVGGLYEAERSRPEIEGVRFDTRLTKLRPFALVRLRASEYEADLGWSRNEDRTRTEGGGSLTLVRDSYNGSLGWLPARLPKSRLYWLRVYDHDDLRAVRDAAQDSLQLLSDFQPVEPLALRYRGSRLETSDRLLGTESRSLLHSGRVTYSDAFWDRRISVAADYDAQYRQVENRSRGEGEAELPLYPISGLSSLDDTPEEDELGLNPALIDGNTAAGAGVDLGLPPPGGDERPRNLGLDFRVPVELNTLFVWVDRDLRPEVAESFTWEVWTSEDGLRWTRRQGILAAPFGPFENRFELRFANVTARFHKLTVLPLAPSVPFASEYPNILVTELEAAIRKSAAEVEGRTTTNANIADLGVRARITETPLLYYELTGYYNRTGDVPSTWTLSNGFLVTHAFSPVWSTAARVAREEGQERSQDRTAYVYSASVSASPFSALRSNLVWSGKDEKLGGSSLDQNSLFLYAIAALYPGVDLNLGVGKNLSTTETRREVDGTQVNVSLALAPHRRSTVQLSWQSRSDEASGGDLAASVQTYTRAAEASVSLRPLDTLYAYASFRREWRESRLPVETRNVAASWAPFPDGDLHVNVSFDEIYRTDLDSLQRTFSPSLRYTLRGGTFLDLAYQRLRLDSILERLETEILSATLRIAF